jgi:hypothetical protein
VTTVARAVGSIPNLYAVLAGAPAAVGALPDAHDRGRPVRPGPFIHLFQRQPADIREEIRRELRGGDGGGLVTCEPSAGGWLLHLWESLNRDRVRVRSVFLPPAARPTAPAPAAPGGVAPPDREQSRGRRLLVTLSLVLAAALGFGLGVVAEQHGLRFRSPFIVGPP